MSGRLEYLAEKRLDFENLRLESENFLKSFLNRHLIGRLMNSFPNLANSLLSRSEGEIARLLYKDREKGTFRVLNEMYDYEKSKTTDVLEKLIMESPAVKAARNRKKIAQYLLKLTLENSKRSKFIFSVGGGNGRLELEVLKDYPVNYYCCLDTDERAILEGEALAKKFRVSDQTIFLKGSIRNKDDLNSVTRMATERFLKHFPYLDIVLCQGVFEYFDMKRCSNRQLNNVLTAIYEKTSSNGILLASQTDYHDRVKYLEKGLDWYMRLRSREEVKNEMERVGWCVEYCEKEPMNLITLSLSSKRN